MSANTHDDLYNLEEEYITEGLFSFRSAEEAKDAIKQIDSGGSFLAWVKWFCTLNFTAGIITGPLVAAFTKWIALPSSAKGKAREYKSAIAKINRGIEKLERKGDKESLKRAKELKKVRDEIQKKFDDKVYDAVKIGRFKSNVTESSGIVFNAFAEAANNELLGDLNFGNSVYSTGTDGNFYMYESAYETYIENKIANEKKLSSILRVELPVKESRLIAIQEAKFSDSVKSKWNKLIEFIKGIARKFMESMSALLLDEKNYLEKYKEIILQRKPKDDLEYSYTGNYKVGIDRIINTELPLFNGSLDPNNNGWKGLDPKIEDDGELAETIIQKDSTGFQYDKEESISSNYKTFFLGGTDQSQGKFSTLNFTDLYNFCYNYKKIEDVQNKDIKHLEQSTSTFVQAYEAELRKAGVNPQDDINKVKPAEENKPTNTAATNNAQGQNNQSDGSATKNNVTSVSSSGNSSDSGKTDTGSGETKDQNTGNGGEKGSQLSSYRLIDRFKKPINEDVDVIDNSKSSGTTSTTLAKATTTYSDKNADGQKDAGTAAAQGTSGNNVTDLINDMNKMQDRWNRVCRTLITAKFTACQQIAKDYMDIIRAHVRSYGGKDIDKAENKKAKQQGTEYKKRDKNAPAENNQEQQPEEVKKGNAMQGISKNANVNLNGIGANKNGNNLLNKGLKGGALKGVKSGNLKGVKSGNK